MGKHKFKNIVYVEHKSTRSQVSRKVQHRTRKAAEDHVAYIGKSTGENVSSMGVYLCAFCDTYHFGHSKERTR
jgi:hypothetical protein